MIYSIRAHECTGAIALTRTINIVIKPIRVLYNQVLYSTSYIHVLYSMKYALYSKKCYIRGILYSSTLYIAWYIHMLYIISSSTCYIAWYMHMLYHLSMSYSIQYIMCYIPWYITCYIAPLILNQNQLHHPCPGLVSSSNSSLTPPCAI